MDETNVISEPEFLLETVQVYSIHLRSGVQLDLTVLPEDTLTLTEDKILLEKAPTPGIHGPIMSNMIVYRDQIAAYQFQDTTQRRRNPKFNKPQTSEAGAPTAVMGKAPEFTGHLTVR